MTRRIGIIGAGAIGSSLGAMLRRSGHDVVLIGRPPHVASIQSAGLRVEGVLGSFSLKIDAATALQSPVDLAFLTVKTQDVLVALEQHRAALQNGTVITFQNGVRSDEMVATAIPREKIASAVVNVHANFLEPGRVTILYAGSLMVGRPFGPADALLGEIATILNDAFPTKVSNSILGAHWLKLIMNLNNALPALTDLSFRDVYRDKTLRNLAVGMMREALAATQRAKIELESLPEMPATLIRAARFLPVPIAGWLAARKISQMASQWPLLGSTLQSVRRGRPTEIDYLNGEIVRLGEQVGSPTPLNARIVELANRVARTGKFLSPSEILASASDAASSQANRQRH